MPLRFLILGLCLVFSPVSAEETPAHCYVSTKAPENAPVTHKGPSPFFGLDYGYAIVQTLMVCYADASSYIDSLNNIAKKAGCGEETEIAEAIRLGTSSVSERIRSGLEEFRSKAPENAEKFCEAARQCKITETGHHCPEYFFEALQ